MLCITGHVSCDVVPTVPVSLYQLEILRGPLKKHVQQYAFLSIDWHHTVKCMIDIHMNKNNMLIIFTIANNSNKENSLHTKITCSNEDTRCIIL